MNSKGLYRIQLVVEGAEEEKFFTIVQQKGLDSSISLTVRNAKNYQLIMRMIFHPAICMNS